jgi:ABC-type phosphate transport system substrate-binding protein
MTSHLARRLLVSCISTTALIIALAAPSGAGAALGAQCSGIGITGQGANVLKNAHTVWDADFNTSTNKVACAGLKGQGTLQTPTVTYKTSSAAIGLESWGANGHVGADFSLANAFIGASEPPNATQKAEIEAQQTTPTPTTLLSIPTVQTAIAVIVNLPSGCTAQTKNKKEARLVLNNATLEGIFRGTITQWSQITDDGDQLVGATCNAASPIIPVVRKDGAGTTHIFKKYLNLINGATFTDEKSGSETWDNVSEGTLNTDWPKAANVTRPEATGDTALDAWVASHPGTIGYTTFAEARANGSFTPSPGTGGLGTARFWVPIQNNGIATTGKLKYADPSSNGESATVADANCKNTEYTNSKEAFPPASTTEPWDEVTTRTIEKKYPLCSIVVELAFSSYSAYPGTTQAEATTVNNFFNFVTNAKGGGGQKLIAKHDYLALPKGKVLTEAEAGAALIGF